MKRLFLLIILMVLLSCEKKEDVEETFCFKCWWPYDLARTPSIKCDKTWDWIKDHVGNANKGPGGRGVSHEEYYVCAKIVD